MISAPNIENPDWAELNFPLVCVNAMSDESLAKLNVMSLSNGFGVGPWIKHFSRELFSFPSDYVNLVPGRNVSEPKHMSSDAEMFLQVLNYQDRPNVTGNNPFVPSIAARLAACLYVLTKSPMLADVYFQPGASETAQRHLSAILVANPVLMHPQFRLPTRTFYINQLRSSSLTVPSVSIANAITLTKYARFPMTNDGLSFEQITEFANNRCTKIGLLARFSSLLSVKTWKKTPFASAIDFDKARPALIASLHELAKLTKKKRIDLKMPSDITDGSNPSLYLNNIADYGGANGFQFGPVYAESFLGACGVSSDEHNVQQNQSPEFFSAFNEMHMSENPDVCNSLNVRILGCIFGSKPIKDPIRNGNLAEMVAQNVHLVAGGLVAAGFVKDLPGAGAWLIARLRGNEIVDTTIECAISFIHALDIYGATVKQDCLASGFISSEPADPGIPSMDQHGFPSPERAIWNEAVRIHEIETAMAQVIHAAHYETKVSNSGARCRMGSI